MMTLREHVQPRRLALAAVPLAAIGVLVASPGLLGDEVGQALGSVAAASPGLLWVAGACFVVLLVSMGAAWAAGVQALGGRVDPVDATARFVTGSLVSALLPAGAGGAVRIGLFSRTLPARERLWQAGGISVAIAAARALVLAATISVAAALGALPLWPVLIFASVGLTAVAVALATRRRQARSRAAHVLDVFAALGRSPACAARLLGWVGLATAARVGAATAVAAAVGVGSPLAAGIVAVAALSLAGIVQLTPGNFGIASGALALALAAVGVDTSTALSTGIAFQAVETGVSLLVGGAGALYLVQAPVPTWTLRLAGGGAALTLAAAFSATVLV